MYGDQRLFVNKHNSDVKPLHTTGGLLSLGLGCLEGRFVGRSVATPFLQSAAAAPRLEGFVLQGEEEEPFHVECASLQDRNQTLHAFQTQEEEKQPQVEEDTVSEGSWPEQPLQWELRAPFAQVERQACKRRSGNLAAQEPLSAVRAAVSCVAELHGVKWTPASHFLLSGTEKVVQCLAPEGSWLRRQEGRPGLARFVSFVEPPRPLAEGDVPHAIREGLASHQSVVGLCATANGKHSEGSSQPEAFSRARRIWSGLIVLSLVFHSIPILKRINLASSVSMCPKLHLRPWPDIKHDQHTGFRCLGTNRRVRSCTGRLNAVWGRAEAGCKGASLSLDSFRGAVTAILEAIQCSWITTRPTGVEAHRRYHFAGAGVVAQQHLQLSTLAVLLAFLQVLGAASHQEEEFDDVSLPVSLDADLMLAVSIICIGICAIAVWEFSKWCFEHFTSRTSSVSTRKARKLQRLRDQTAKAIQAEISAREAAKHSTG